MKNLLLPLAFFIHHLAFSILLPAQTNIEWQKCLGGSGVEEARDIQQTSDDGYVVTGKTFSSNGDVTSNHGVSDFWVVKLSSNGAVEWQNTYGGTNHDRSYSIQQTNDGGYIVAGQTESNNGDVSGLHGDIDFWVVKLDSIGTIQWQKTLGGSDWDEAWSVRQTTDGGYIVAGRSVSNDGDVTGNHGAFDFWVVKLNGIGAIEWQKSLGGSMDDIGYSVRQTLDGGFIVTGESASTDGDATGLHGSTDYWVVKLSATGELVWQKMLGSTSLDRPNDVCPTSDGGYIVVGLASWSDGDVTGNHGGFDYWAVKLNGAGDIQWQKSLGGSDEDFAQSVQQTSDGGYVMSGWTRSEDGDVLDNDGGQDIWLVKLTDEGEIQWQKALGGNQGERAYSTQQTLDGGYIVAGLTTSNNGDVSGFHGTQDFWVVKLSPESVGTEEASAHTVAGQINIFPNPAASTISLKIPAEEPTFSVRITDLLGREMLWQEIANGSASGGIDISTLPKGLYLVVADAASGRRYAGKVVKA